MAVMERSVVDGPVVVRERLEAFAAGVLGEAVNRQVQLVNGELYLRGLIEGGSRKSLEPMVARLGGEADYESLQQFLAVSPWDPALVVRAVAERVAPEIAVQAWVLDDTGFPKDGKHSPGVKRQYSGTLGKIGNCQIGVSVHAVGAKGTIPLGWALYLPEEWCEDPERRRKAKIPEEIGFKTKPAIALDQLLEARHIDLLAYYQKGTGVAENEDTMSSIILGASMLTGHGVPVAGEYEVKNVIAMKIMDLLGFGGSFTEYYAMDFAEDLVLMGHDGPGHIGIAQDKIASGRYAAADVGESDRTGTGVADHPWSSCKRASGRSPRQRAAAQRAGLHPFPGAGLEVALRRRLTCNRPAA